MKAANSLKRYLLVGVFILLELGCDDSKQRGISGKVYTDPKLDHSLILSGDITENTYEPIVDADVSLAYDSKGARIISGSTVKTNVSGAYHINTNKLPPPKDSSGSYYLVVKKEGYELIVYPIRIGMMSSYQQNRVVLSQLRAGKQKKPADP